MSSEARQGNRVKLAGLPIRGREARRALSGTGLGHALSAEWLPAAGVVGEAVAAERAEHLRLLAGLRGAVDAYHAVGFAYAEEDRERERVLRVHARDGGKLRDDGRTPAVDREATLDDLIGRVEAALLVLAEHVEHVVAVLREREDELLGGLTAALAPAAAKREEAERLVAEATREEFALHRAAMWLKATTDDHAFARQPAPTGSEVPPPSWSGRVAPEDLARRWHGARPWNDAYEPPENMASWQESEDAKDGTGEVTGLVEHAGSAA